jgi:hypothetical protein
MNVIQLAPPPSLPADLPALLRTLADAVEGGIVTEMFLAYVEKDEYKFCFPSSNNVSLILTTLAQTNAIERMRRNA